MKENKENHNQYDIIGDIHGHADTLRALLAKLGYRECDEAYRQAKRRVIFVGDLIDRGPKICETLKIVRAMVRAGTALVVLGNHEINAIRYHTSGSNGRPLRPHSEKNERLHRATLDQLVIPHPGEWSGWLKWFKTLPLYLDLGGLRVVHAAWSEASIRFLGARRFDDTELLIASSRRGTAEYNAVRALLNGPELTLPDCHCSHDEEGRARTEIRAKWFGPRANGHPLTYRDLVLPASNEVPEIEVSAETLATLPGYGEHEPPVIFGHYWMPPVALRCLSSNATCVDYSVAAKHNGLLAAYRWSGEAKLSDANFVTEARGIRRVA